MTDEKPKSPEIADEYLGVNHVAYRNGEYHRHTGTHYQKMTVDQKRHIIANWIIDRHGVDAATHCMVSECLGIIRDRSYIQGTHQPFRIRDPDRVASVLVVENGELDLEPMYEGEPPILRPHSPELFATSAVDYEHDPDARCPKFDEFLKWMACGDTAVEQLLLEFMAYCLLRDLQFQRMVVLQGGGSNGKSVYLNTLRRMVGAANCSALSLDRFGGRFDLSALADMAVNITADEDQVDRVSEGVMKQLVDCSEIAVERKHQPVAKMINHARIIMACNSMPRWRDTTDGLWRRMIPIPCLAKVAGSEIVRNLESQFEMAGVLNRVIAAGRDLIARGDFEIPVAVKRATEVERMAANPCSQFLREHVAHRHHEDFMVTMEAFKAYRNWCLEAGYKPLAIHRFGLEVRSHFSKEIDAGRVVPNQKSKGKKRQNGYGGLKFYPDGNNQEDDELTTLMVATEAEMVAAAEPPPPKPKKFEIDSTTTETARILQELGVAHE